MKSVDRVIGRSGNPASSEAARPTVQHHIAQHIRSGCHLVLATLREIFDENAYARFLQRTQTLRSAESYWAFLKEREAGVAQRPRCC
jgi:hypothetical protein